MNEVKIYVEDNGNRNYENTDVLLKQLNDEYDKPRPIILQLSDTEGQVITGRCVLVAGTLEDGSFLLTGNVDDVIFIKDKVATKN